jgi:hypothetical protein
MANAIDQEMSNYFKQLNDAEKQSVVQMLKTFLKGRKDQPERISVEQYNKEIDEAMERVTKGEFTTVEDLAKEMQSW